MSSFSLAREGSLMVEAFERLFPHFRKRNKADPRARSALMGSICNFAKCAFGAYDGVADGKGFVEYTTASNKITHLNWDCLNDTMEGMLKIHLKNAENLKDADWGLEGQSDPFVVFRHGGTVVRSRTINNTANPNWNSTHYLCLRKRHVEAQQDSGVTVSVYDDDSHGGMFSVLNMIDKNDHLGEAVFDLDQVKAPGIHEMSLELPKKSVFQRRKTILNFTVEFVSVEAALSEMGKEKGSDAWEEFIVPAPGKPEEIQWPRLAQLTNLGDLPLEPVAFFDVAETGSQAWIFVDQETKVLAVAFRGTETRSLKDVMIDQSCFPPRLSEDVKSNEYLKLKATEKLRDSSIRVHSGFNKAYDSIRESILRIVHDLTEWDDSWIVCVTGHSLGGALATMCAFEMSNRELPLDTTDLTPGDNGSCKLMGACMRPKIAMVNYGCPRVGNAAFANAYNATVVESLRIVNAGDPVHFLPPFYTHTKHEVLVKPNGEVDLAGRFLGKRSHADRALQAIENHQPGVEEADDENERRGIVSMIAGKHLQTYYFKIVERAVNAFQKRDDC